MKASTSILRALTYTREQYILDSELPEMAAALAKAREESTLRAKWQRVTSSSWFVAAACAVVALGVFGGILWLGQHDPGTTPISPPTTGTIEQQSEMSPETEPPVTVPITEGLAFAPVEDEDGYCSVVGIGEATDTVLHIPETSPDGLTVKYIGEYAFQGNTEITEVILPDTVEVIQMYAFNECTALRKVTLGSGFIEIKGRGFGDCTALSEINLKPEHAVGSFALWRTPWFEALTDEFVIYGGHLIDYNGYGGDVVIPAGVKYIEGGSFTANKLINTLTVPDGCEYIFTSAFQECYNLTHVVLAPSVQLLDSGAFAFCISLMSIEMPGVTAIGFGAFRGTPLLSVDLPAATAIYGDAFYGCSYLSSVTFGNDLIGFLEGAFTKTALTEVILPASTRRMGVSAMSECPELVRVETPAEYIENYCFESCPKLREIILLDGVQTICDDIFRNCDALERVAIPVTVTEIGHISAIPSENFVIEYAGTAEEWANIQMDAETSALLATCVQFAE